MHITESLNQILSQRKQLTERFDAEKLFKAYPEFVPHFSGANMKVQR